MQKPHTASGAHHLTFASHSFGCRVNQAEKEFFDRQLIATGFEYDGKHPAIFIINTCAVTEKAEREARQLIYQTRKKLPDTKIIVTGCAATRWKKDKIQVIGVDILIGNNNKDCLTALINAKFKIKNAKPSSKLANQKIMFPNFQSGSDFCTLNSQLYNDKYLSSGRAILKIQDGCQRFCTYCIVPYLRGKPQSAKINEIITQINGFPSPVREVILTAVNTEAFGSEYGESFTDLITSILKNTYIERLSFGSINPWSLTEGFFRLYEKEKGNPRLVDFFHIPVQSGSDRILKLMKREYTASEMMDNLRRLHKINPYAFIGTDVIVGFPGETEKDFEETYGFLEKSPVSRFHIFRYSRRPGTAAYFMAKQLKESTPQVKSSRAKKLADLSMAKYRKFLENHIGKTFQALLLPGKKDGYREALLENQVPVRVKGILHDSLSIIRVIVQRRNNDTLIGVYTK